ncbi:hypothetical protein H072_3635 [Dactylellina haptotyla CBS 200.50]|uniref:Uncharacterized protein n=1 Tax=Dactylellina haptotyla (strain CBS 200.50) TaxID=1284197 RepID=S8BSM1_DACHA|nr:hypothetical protein H072_3635 [Dactylellina haptotyla CBS 200.50]
MILSTLRNSMLPLILPLLIILTPVRSEIESHVNLKIYFTDNAITKIRVDPKAEPYCRGIDFPLRKPSAFSAPKVGAIIADSYIASTEEIKGIDFSVYVGEDALTCDDSENPPYDLMLPYYAPGWNADKIEEIETNGAGRVSKLDHLFHEPSSEDSDSDNDDGNDKNEVGRRPNGMQPNRDEISAIMNRLRLRRAKPGGLQNDEDEAEFSTLPVPDLDLFGYDSPVQLMSNRIHDRVSMYEELDNLSPIQEEEKHPSDSSSPGIKKRENQYPEPTKTRKQGSTLRRRAIEASPSLRPYPPPIDTAESNGPANKIIRPAPLTTKEELYPDSQQPFLFFSDPTSFIMYAKVVPKGNLKNQVPFYQEIEDTNSIVTENDPYAMGFLNDATDNIINTYYGDLE